MTLFGFGKKKEKEINAPVCTCNGNCSVSETVEPENLNNCCQDIQGRICCIKVLGSGCCHALYENTQSAVKAMGISVEVEYITDLKKVMEYGVMSVPALVVNNKVVSTGKVLKTENVQKLLQKIVSEKSSLIHLILHKTGTITSGFEGKKRKQIADELCVSDLTVKTHVSHIYTKLGIHSKEELIELVRERASSFEE